MHLLNQVPVVDYDDYREQKTHGEEAFPFSIYNPCVIPDTFREVLLHWHEEMEIIYIREGKGIISVNLESHEVEAPALVLVLPGQLHAIRQYRDCRMLYENIIFHPRLLYSRYGGICDMDYLQPLFEGRIQIPAVLDSQMQKLEFFLEPLKFCNEVGSESPGYPLLVKSQLYILCYRLLQAYPREEGKRLEKEHLNRIKPVLSYIEKHYAEPIRVEDAASLMGFSGPYFMRCFKEVMGVTFVGYLTDYRLARAEESLRTTRQSVLDVAQENGFRNFSYFIRVFKMKYGRTPLKYREYQLSRKEDR